MAHKSPFEPAHKIKVLLRRRRLCKYAGSSAHSLPAYRREKANQRNQVVGLTRALGAPIYGTQIATYRNVECRRLRRACANMQTCQSIRSHRWHTTHQHEILVPLMHCRATKAQESRCKCADSPAPSLLS